MRMHFGRFLKRDHPHLHSVLKSAAWYTEMVTGALAGIWNIRAIL